MTTDEWWEFGVSLVFFAGALFLIYAGVWEVAQTFFN